MRASHVVTLALLMALGTGFVGWWAVPALGGVWGLLAHHRRKPGRTAAVGAIVAWLALLAWSIPTPATWVLAERLGGVFGVGSLGWFAVTLALALAAGGSAATFTATLKRSLR